MRALEETLQHIFPLDSASEEEWRARLAGQENLTPMAVRLTARLAGIGRGPLHPHQPLVAVFTAAHGIARKRPMPEPPAVYAGDWPVLRVDMGQNGGASGDICRGPAMSIATARQTVETGISLADEWRAYDLFAIAGDSAGALYAASAIAARCLGEYKESDLPPGIEAALMTDILSAACDGKNGLDLLAALGGFDLGGAAGLMLALAARHRPIVLSDFAATAAALVAARLEPFIRDYLFATAAICPLHQAALTLLGAPVLFSGQAVGQALAELIAASSLFIEAGHA